MLYCRVFCVLSTATWDRTLFCNHTKNGVYVNGGTYPEPTGTCRNLPGTYRNLPESPGTDPESRGNQNNKNKIK